MSANELHRIRWRQVAVARIHRTAARQFARDFKNEAFIISERYCRQCFKNETFIISERYCRQSLFLFLNSMFSGY